MEGIRRTFTEGIMRKLRGTQWIGMMGPLFFYQNAICSGENSALFHSWEWNMEDDETSVAYFHEPVKLGTLNLRHFSSSTTCVDCIMSRSVCGRAHVMKMVMVEQNMVWSGIGRCLKMKVKVIKYFTSRSYCFSAQFR